MSEHCPTCQGGDYTVCVDCGAHFWPRNSIGLCFECRFTLGPRPKRNSK